MRKVPLLVALSLLPLGPGSASGQGWTLDLYGGRVAYDLATSAPEENVAVLGVRYRDPGIGWLSLSSGVPFGSNDSLWGAASTGTRLVRRARSVDVGVDLGVQGYLYDDPALSSVGRGGTLEIRPLLGVGSGRVRLESRSGWVRYGSAIASSRVSRGVHDSDLAIQVSLGPSAAVSGTVRHVRAEEGAFSFGGVRLAIGSGRVSGWGSIGVWSSDSLPSTQWDTGATVRLDPQGRTHLAFSIRQDASDPLHWNPPRQGWSFGLSHRLGGGSDPDALDDRSRFAAVSEVRAGLVTIRIPKADQREAPFIAGDFNGWTPEPMAADRDHWSFRVELAPGVYRYAFRAPSGEWYVPESVPSRRPDGMGGFVAVLLVS